MLAAESVPCTPHRSAAGCLHSGAQAARIASGFLMALSPAPSAECGEAVRQVAHALVSNALRHAGQASHFRMCATEDAVHIWVTDPSPLLPHTLEGGEGGWARVSRLSRTVNLHPHPHGKTVHAILPR